MRSGTDGEVAHTAPGSARRARIRASPWSSSRAGTSPRCPPPSPRIGALTPARGPSGANRPIGARIRGRRPTSPGPAVGELWCILVTVRHGFPARAPSPPWARACHASHPGSRCRPPGQRGRPRAATWQAIPALSAPVRAAARRPLGSDGVADARDLSVHGSVPRGGPALHGDHHAQPHLRLERAPVHGHGGVGVRASRLHDPRDAQHRELARRGARARARAGVRARPSVR